MGFAALYPSYLFLLQLFLLVHAGGIAPTRRWSGKCCVTTLERRDDQIGQTGRAAPLGGLRVPGRLSGSVFLAFLLYEILGCGTSILAARVGAMARTLAEFPECLYAPDDPAELEARMRRQ